MKVPVKNKVARTGHRDAACFRSPGATLCLGKRRPRPHQPVDKLSAVLEPNVVDRMFNFADVGSLSD